MSKQTKYGLLGLGVVTMVAFDLQHDSYQRWDRGHVRS